MIVDAIENQIIDAYVAGLNGITGQPAWRTAPYVRRGLSQEAFTSARRPLVAVLQDGDSETVKVMGKRHDVELHVIVYIETAEREDAEAHLIEVIEDVMRRTRELELLKTTLAPAGLLIGLMRKTESQRVVDVSGKGGIGAAELSIVAPYRLVHG